jgi:glycosyltransferase involved in cell wall biosynthesis
MNIPLTLGFVIPWYGDTIGGGAEAECRALVKLLQAHGCKVEVLTTCVKDFRSDWSIDHHQSGVSLDGGVQVRRFAVRRRDSVAFDEVNRKLMYGEQVSDDDEECFFREMINSPALYEYIERHRKEYLYFFIPYMFGTTYYGSMACPERSVLIPCLHDESYARLRPVRQMFRTVRDILFLSPEEETLARRMYDLPPSVGKVIGGPIDLGWSSHPSKFRLKFGLSRFLLYAGRTDTGKGADLLVEYFDRYMRERATNLRLVFIGGGSPVVPKSISHRVHLLGYLPEQDKYDCLGASVALCIPSVMESFSIVMMESWLAGRPVIVNEKCAVTTDLCKRANGGLYFDDYEDFKAIVDYFLESPEVADSLGEQGRNYVRANYAPQVIAERYLTFARSLLEDGF